ncbi:MAG TPA: hypothetical protein VNZ53_39325 [Steroidobacteraceae bacterium]|nr:hypothetical protein [Steroidobacteraceae bacterium]
MQIDPVQPIAAHIKPQRALVLHLRRRNRIELELEAVVLGKRLQERDRLLAIGRVEMYETDPLALELVKATFSVGRVTDEG